MAQASASSLTWVALVPAYNEQDRIAATVRSLRELGMDVYVVDDGSRDDTASQAKKAGATTLVLPKNEGKGGALAAGLKEIPPCRVLILADGDLAETAGRLRPLAEAVASGADVAIAQFHTRGGFGLAKKMARWGIRRLTGHDMQSPLSGQRALSERARRILKDRIPRGWGMEVGMTVQALWHGLNVVEIPIELTHRETKRNFAGFWHRGRQWRDIAVTLVILFVARRKGRKGF